MLGERKRQHTKLVRVARCFHLLHARSSPALKCSTELATAPIRRVLGAYAYVWRKAFCPRPTPHLHPLPRFIVGHFIADCPERNNYKKSTDGDSYDSGKHNSSDKNTFTKGKPMSKLF
ncbi:hypothetical protein GUJ93_ZPchr0002g23823 [Zizania palustris]|uniref:Uncharacterized protein n=1 Tax=Zizania palustris TaxID=103762 RepID=A0A8J5RUM3_ZIZPA|nr:hypothetical protein GUJ93_ZPchr0002g23823 [Zizania palustris]